MKQVVLKINGLSMVNFDPSNFLAKMTLFYEVSGEKKSIVLNLNLMQRTEVIVEGIMNFVRSQGKQEVDERDDILDQLYTRNLLNEDKVEEKLFHYFAKLCEKVKFMKTNKNHVDHMKFYQDIKGSKISL